MYVRVKVTVKDDNAERTSSLERLQEEYQGALQQFADALGVEFSAIKVEELAGSDE